MFYKQFLKITDTLNSVFVENFDFWLATLPQNNQKNIMASDVASRLGVKYSLAEAILSFACKEGIVEKYYLVKCPACDYILETVSLGKMADLFSTTIYCLECDEDKRITTDDVYVAYKVLLQPNVSEMEIAQAIEKRLNLGSSEELNFTNADSLTNNIINIYEAFYNPSESAYQKFIALRSKLDLDYGANTTAKGKALEGLILEIFNQISGVVGTNDVKTETNQFDCTMLCRIKTISLSIFDYLAPYFIIECKNENKKPDNTYINKLESILHTNDARLGIVWGRKDATGPCFTLSREQYLVTRDSGKQQIIITCSDKDLEYILDKRVNLLHYLDFKIFQITSNSPKSTFEMFLKTQT